MADLLISRLHSASGTESSNDEDDLPLTQPIEKPLADVIAFVDVRLGRNKSINTGKTISAKLNGLGATISTRLTKDVTHIVYKDGKTNIERIDRDDLFVVSPLWVESCNRCNEQVSEAKYPVVTMDTGIEGGVSTTPIVLGKIKRIRSMQPKPFVEEDVQRSVERNRKRPAVTDETVNKSSKSVDPFDYVLSDNDDEEEDSHQKDLSNVFVHEKRQLNKSRPSKTTKKKTRILQSHYQKVFIETKSKNTTTPETKRTKPSLSTIIEAKENEHDNSDNKMATVPVKVEGYSYGRKKRRSFEKKRPGIVITSLEPSERETVLAVINSLGRFDVTKTVDEDTTHVVCGPGTRRTVNALAGTVKGCWLLSVDWIWNSLEAAKWSPEEAFEMVTEFPAAQFFRLERQQAGLLYRPSLFHEGGSIYVSKNTKPTTEELEMLLNVSGAKLTGSKRKADICIGPCQSCGADTVMLSEQWIIDSISEHKMLPLDEYAIDSNGSFLRATSPEL